MGSAEPPSEKQTELCNNRLDIQGRTTEATGENYGQELYLTPLLEAGQVSEARAACKVQNLGLAIESYSGYLTVNRRYNSNLFFWFFPATSERENAPIIIWLQGGPGSSSLIGLFSENGPIRVDDAGNLQYRETGSWSRAHSMLYIDNPVGAGLSFTEHDDGYPVNQQEISDDLYSAVTQFYQLFPELRQNDLYLAGQSYAGKYIPTLGVEIHSRNLLTDIPRINLKGCIIGSSFTDPFVQIDWGEYLHNMGLIDDREKDEWDLRTKEMRRHIQNGRFLQAFNIMQHDVFGFEIPEPTTFELTTGLRNAFNILEQDHSPHFRNYRKWLSTPAARAAIHVGSRNLDFGSTKSIVFQKLAEDIPKSARTELEALLNAGYAVLLFGLQFDLTVPHQAVERLIKSCSGWTMRDEFLKCARKEVWKVRGEIAGWRKTHLNLTQYFVRNAGHMGITDQPEWALNMVTHFIAQDKEKIGQIQLNH